MATNVQLELEITALKAEVATLKASSAEAVKAELDALKKALREIFSFRYFEQPDTSNAWDRITKKAAEQETSR